MSNKIVSGSEKSYSQACSESSHRRVVRSFELSGLKHVHFGFTFDGFTKTMNRGCLCVYEGVLDFAGIRDPANGIVNVRW